MRQRDIVLFWLPLFASWLLMTAEGPVISAAINRLPDEVIMLAAQGIVMSLSVTVESPIINLLATSTALAKDRPSYLLLRRFTIHWMIGLTIVAALLAFTPLFDLVVVQWMAVPAPVAAWVQPGLKIMVPWSAAIGWRRFLQGLMIRFRQTRLVAWGTVVRLVASAGTAIGLAVWSGWPGVIIGATALVVGVTAEALYATYAVRPILANQLGPDSRVVADPPLTYRELFWFHLPLAATSVLILLVQPLVTFSLARLDQPTLSLAAWPLVFQIMLIARAPAMALPEVVIALSEGESTFRPLRHFSRNLVIFNTAAILLFIFTPLVNFYLLTIQDTTPPVAELAQQGLQLFFLLPALYILISWVRGLLISSRTTRLVNVGMAVNLVLTGLVLALGIWQQWPGIDTAAVALTVAAAAEFAFLWWQSRTILGYRLTLADSRAGRG